jgi:hypothetical protein
MPTTLSQSHDSSVGDLIAYTLGLGDEVDIVVGENVDTAAAPKRAYVILSGESVYFTGQLTFTGADAVLNFTLPADLRPRVDETLLVASNDGGVHKVSELVVVAATGVATVTQQDAAAFASGDTVTLSGSYLRA